MSKIAETIEVFEAARKPLFMVLDGISREDLDWRPSAKVRGVGQICRHLYRVDIWCLKRLGIVPVITEDAPGPAEEIAARMRTIQEQIIAEVRACENDADLFAERTSLDGKDDLAARPRRDPHGSALPLPLPWLRSPTCGASGIAPGRLRRRSGNTPPT